MSEKGKKTHLVPPLDFLTEMLQCCSIPVWLTSAPCVMKQFPCIVQLLVLDAIPK